MSARPARTRIGRLVPFRVRRPVGRAAYRLVVGSRHAWHGTRARIVDAVGTIPFLPARDLVYTDEFFTRVDAESRPLYDLLVDSLAKIWAPRTVLDVGCGSGYILDRFAQRGVEVRGIEGSRAAIRMAASRGRIVRANLERGVPRLGRFDLCLCLEVGEHLRARAADGLVDGLTSSSDVVLFTAAHPGQPGRAHLNTQPKRYWQALFAGHGFERSPREKELAAAISSISQPAYIHENLMVFERVLSDAN
jgi:SAM-dependent methyltransferase